MYQLYIDPGTGSMLFAILIGIIGALGYLLRSLLVKIRFVLSGGKKVETNKNTIPIAIFSDDKRYWNVFKPICEEFNNRGVDVVYMTASSDDPALDSNLEHIDVQFIGEGNKAFSKLNFLNATIVLSTTPGLDVYQWKRSKEVKYYVHITHSACDVTGYHMFGIDYYDAVLLSGEYQIEQVRDLETLRALPEKEVLKIGIPYMDKMLERYNESPKKQSSERTVLLAPSWGKSGILSKFGDKIIEALLDTGYHIIVRPHPQSFVSEAEIINSIMQRHPESDQLEWNMDNDNFDVLMRSDIMISDFSGVIYDFALVYDKPVIYADTDFDTSPYDAWWLDKKPWKIEVLPRLGKKLTEDSFEDIKSIIDECIDNPAYKEKRQAVCDEAWEHKGEGAKLTVDYIIDKYNQLTAKEVDE